MDANREKQADPANAFVHPAYCLLHQSGGALMACVGAERPEFAMLFEWKYSTNPLADRQRWRPAGERVIPEPTRRRTRRILINHAHHTLSCSPRKTRRNLDSNDLTSLPAGIFGSLPALNYL